MLRSLSSSLIGALLLVACSTDQPAASPAAPTVSQPTTTSSPGPVSPSTTLASPTTTSTTTNVDDSITPDIDSAVPEKHLENYLAALAAGAYEQAGFPATNAGTAFGDNQNIAAADYLGAACEPDLCNGPYTVEPDDPFIQYDGIAPPRWNFSVTHEQSGQTATMSVGMFEGQFVIADLPPLVESPRPDDLLTQLFGSDRPDYAVVERFDAFEVWTADTTTWVTN
ncbi:MAG: hypothetical protein JJE47_03500 [Acidimicrobiia bacterium]|nr:hypothetical protein [Acidimicrobiia bacterium]